MAEMLSILRKADVLLVWVYVCVCVCVCQVGACDVLVGLSRDAVSQGACVR